MEQKSFTKNRAVVIRSDHGFHLGNHDRWAEHTQFEQATRCPTIVRLPDRHSVVGSTKAIVESVDIYLTLCKFAGLEVPDFAESQLKIVGTGGLHPRLLRGESL